MKLKIKNLSDNPMPCYKNTAHAAKDTVSYTQLTLPTNREV